MDILPQQQRQLKAKQNKGRQNLLIKIFIVQVPSITLTVANATKTHRETIIKPFKVVKKLKITY